ncbi:conserved hypothetical protein [Pediculus humanus corporis]|uniref:Uncharacterized protein n=1 Tax=Pediculus humanus subsp. corporis TaxID=121224 RepID=E0VW00_PEDHC|nr:uncharacterized protein Phum_PHUM472500 [Pediculus humanus corporis]EEB17556.1 conserved hypothetical protein [Pediculus humanus corporis]
MESLISDIHTGESLLEQEKDANRKSKPFQKFKSPTLDDFSVNFTESRICSQSNESSSFSKSEKVFKRNEYATDPFNTFHTDQDLTESPNDHQKNDDSEFELSSMSTSILKKDKRGAFKNKPTSNKNFFNIDNEETITNVKNYTSDIRSFLLSQPTEKPVELENSLSDTINVTNLETNEKQEARKNNLKTQLFRKSQKKKINHFEVEFNESNIKNVSDHELSRNSIFKKSNKSILEENYNITNVTLTLENNKSQADGIENTNGNEDEKCEKTSNDNIAQFKETQEAIRGEEMHVSKLIEKSNISLMNKLSFNNDAENSDTNFGLNNSSSKHVNTDTYFEQSSINDENLKCWMSDNSEEEISPPCVPRISTNLSNNKENLLKSNKNFNKSVSFEKSSWDKIFDNIVSNVKKNDLINNSIKKKKVVVVEKEKEKIASNGLKKKKQGPFVTKKLHQYILNKLKPKYGIDTNVRAEEIEMRICDTVKIVTRRKSYQKSLTEKLKKEMATVGLISTTVDFYETKVIPCHHPITNSIYPPKAAVNPFDEILLKH